MQEINGTRFVTFLLIAGVAFVATFVTVGYQFARVIYG